jgi:hypothetical protein
MKPVRQLFRPPEMKSAAIRETNEEKRRRLVDPASSKSDAVASTSKDSNSNEEKRRRLAVQSRKSDAVASTSKE